MISVIIPCFNSGQFLDDAIVSVLNSVSGYDVEIVVVDDGSTDARTLALLEHLTKQGEYIILHQANGGPAAARNKGVKASNGKYIIFLDSDNKLKPNFINKSLAVMDSSPLTGVVYGRPDFFGDETARQPFETGPYNIDALIESNYIDMCSMVRKEAWDDVHGLDEDRVLIGFEDWEFWLHISSTNWKFIFIPETLYDYRLRSDSVIAGAASDGNYRKVKEYIYRKHALLIMDRFSYLYHQSKFYELDQHRPIRSFLKYSKQKFLKRNNL